MRWRQKFRLLATLFRGKKKRKMLKYGRAKPEADQDEGRKVREDVAARQEDRGSLQQSCDSTDPEDEVFEVEITQSMIGSRFPQISDSPSDCQSDDCIQVLSPSRAYIASSSPQGTPVTRQVPSITVEYPNYSRESTPPRTIGQDPPMVPPLPKMNQNAKSSVAFQNGGEIKSTKVGTEASGNGPEYDQQIRRYRCRARRSGVSHIKVKYTKVYGESDGAYKNDSTPRGLVFMCNFSKFKDQYSERVGSQTDFENMFVLFQQMGYDVTHRKSKFCRTGYITKKDFIENLKTFSQDPKHKRVCCCVVTIMSHGSGPKTFITSDNEEVDLMEVYSIFDNVHCEYLRGKPKLFILQFCRNNPSDLPGRQGKRPSESVAIHADMVRMVVREEIRRYLRCKDQDDYPQLDGDEADGDISPQSPLFLAAIERISRNTSVASFSSLIEPSTTPVAGEAEGRGSSRALDDLAGGAYHTDTRNVDMLPHEGVQRYSDMYSIFSTSSGELSHRDPRKGSLLIQAICHVFADCAYQDEIDTLVRKVSMYMTKTLQKDDPITVPRQTCERTNNGLDKYFYFNPQEVHFLRNVTI